MIEALYYNRPTGALGMPSVTQLVCRASVGGPVGWSTATTTARSSAKRTIEAFFGTGSASTPLCMPFNSRELTEVLWYPRCGNVAFMALIRPLPGCSIWVLILDHTRKISRNTYVKLAELCVFDSQCQHTTAIGRTQRIFCECVRRNPYWYSDKSLPLSTMGSSLL